MTKSGEKQKKRSPRRSELGLEQVADDLATVEVDGAPQGVDVEGAGEGVGEAEEEHGGDPAAGILESEAVVGHAVLPDDATGHEVHGAGRVDVGLEVARLVGPLLALEDVEEVVGRVPPRVALRAYRCPEDDQVLGNA